jgi:hypothetical protein
MIKGYRDYKKGIRGKGDLKWNYLLNIKK